MLANSKVASKYARALFSISDSKGISKKIFEELLSLKQGLMQTSTLWDIINSQVYSNNTRIELVTQLSRLLKLDPYISNLLVVMSQNRRLDIVVQVIEKYAELYYISNNERVVSVVSASGLTADQTAEIDAFLKEFLQQKILIENVTDISIIGGVIIKFGSFVLDNSIANKLNSVKLMNK